MEILYQINSLDELNEIPKNNDVIVRWLKMPDDYELFCEHLKEKYPNGEFSLDERGNGYAKEICHFATKFILENNKIATCRTEEDNIAMQHVINALGFKKVAYI